MSKMSKWIPTTDLMALRRFGKLGEELAELQAVAARCIIQGIDEIDPASKKMNRDRLWMEMADVLAQIDCCIAAFNIDRGCVEFRRAEKVRQMAEWESLFEEANTQ